MAILVSIMKVLGNVWVFAALLIAIYVLACIPLKKYFAEK